MNSTEVKIVVQGIDGSETQPLDDEEKSTKHSLDIPKRNSLVYYLSDDAKRKASLDPLQIEESFSRSRRASSISSLGNWTGAVIVSDATEIMPTTGKWKAVVDFLDLTLLNDPVYVNIVLGISFALYSDMAFFTLQPLYLFELGYSKVISLFEWDCARVLTKSNVI